MEIFIVDSNFFIEAHRVNYPIDIAQSFWNKVKQLADNGKLISIDKVKEELYDKNDALEHWCKENLPKNFFKDTSETISQYSVVTQWVVSKNTHYLPQAINEFLDANEADAFLIAYALANKKFRLIVTQELSEPNRKNKVKIPDCCNELNIRYMNTIQMFRYIGETF